MIVNAARSHQPLLAHQSLASQDELIKRVNDNQWIEAVKQGGEGKP